ncbi:620_t:CDS:2, partial [Ambispora leptoticha]
GRNLNDSSSAQGHTIRKVIMNHQVKPEGSVNLFTIVLYSVRVTLTGILSYGKDRQLYAINDLSLLGNNPQLEVPIIVELPSCITNP